MGLSFWERESFLRNADVAIIGSGIVGLSAAIALKEKHPSLGISIIERGSMPNGASTKNAGFACFGSVSELLDDLQHNTEEEVFAIVRMRWLGLKRLRRRVGDAAMQYEGYGNYELFIDHEERDYERCLEYLDYLNARTEEATGVPSPFKMMDNMLPELGFRKVRHLIWNSAEGQINTGKMMKALLNKAESLGISMFNGLTVSHIEDTGSEVILFTDEGWNWRVRRVLVATNGFARRLLPELQVKPARNQVLITKELPQIPFRGCFHYNRGYVYFRNIGRRILLGGGRHLDLDGEQTDYFGFTERIYRYQLNMLHNYILPNSRVEVDYRWSGILGVGDQKRPIIQTVSPNVAVSVRMGGMGVAIGSLVGEQGAKLVMENE